MLFTSYGFIAFLAVLFVLYYLIPKRFQWLLLLAADIVFYACAGWKGLCFMAATVVVSWAATNLMGASLAKQKAFLRSDEGKALERAERKAYKKQCEKRRKVIFVLALVADLGILAALKYTNFLITNVNALFSADIAAVDWVLPLGISFYTFQTVSYVIDVYWEKVEPEKNILRVALFTSFFPLLIQGPISRFGDLKDTLFAEHKANFKQISFGLQRILWGYFKKLVIADRLLVAVTALCGDPATYTGAYVFIGAVLYAAELYADFTGGIDITIGVAQVLGIKVKENFIRPYFSRNIAEYWRRWHISMGTWFKDYIFYPLSVAPWLLKLSKSARKKISDGFGRKLSVYVSTIVTWFLTGLWHGAAWNFVLWGGYFGLLLLTERLWLGKRLARAPAAVQHALLLLLVTLGFVLFRAESLQACGQTLRAMFGGAPLWDADALYALRSFAGVLVLGVVGATRLPKRLWKRLEPHPVSAALGPVLTGLLLLAATAALVDGSFNPFLYFRF